MDKELEAKYFIQDKGFIRGCLENIGLKLIKPEFLMRRKTFDAGIKGKWIRIRDEGDRTTMTFKHITGATIDDVLEKETTVGSFDVASEIVNQTDFKEKSFQENYREIWQNEEVEIVIDTWPYLQPYIEIEAKNIGIIRRYSEFLGFDLSRDAFFGSVDILYRKQYGIPTEEFVKIPKIVFDDKNLLEILNLYKNDSFKVVERGINVQF